jgi:Big-like domain-containing protein
MYLQKSPVYATLSLFTMCIVLMSFFSACSSSGGNALDPGNAVSTGNSGGTDTLPSGTGGISFQVVMQPKSGSQVHKLTPAFNSCVDNAIGTITATVLSGATTVASTSWPCSAHQGSILGVPGGTNYTLTVSGISSGTTIWSGQITSLTVNAGGITNAGTLTLRYVGTDTTPPTVTSIAPNSNQASVPVTDRFNIVFSESMAISTVTSTNISLNNGSVPGTVSYDRTTNTAAFIPSSPLEYNTQYVLQVTPCVGLSCLTDAAGNQLLSSPTNTFTFTTESAPGGIANQPTGLTAKPGNGQVTLDWPAVNGATSYNVYYDTVTGVTTTGTPLLGVRAPAVHLGLTNGTTYFYIVTAVTDTNGVLGESPASAESSATPTAPTGNPLPLPPADLAVTFNTGGPYTVTWTPVSGLTYNLYWSPRGIYPDHTAADNVIRNVTGGSVVHSGVITGVTYCYIVTANNSAGESADSMQVCGPGAGSISIVWP